MSSHSKGNSLRHEKKWPHKTKRCAALRWAGRPDLCVSCLEDVGSGGQFHDSLCPQNKSNASIPWRAATPALRPGGTISTGFSLGAAQSCRATPHQHRHNHGNQEPGIFSELVPQDRVGDITVAALGRGQGGTAAPDPAEPGDAPPLTMGESMQTLRRCAM